jgi:hypothetical protein
MTTARRRAAVTAAIAAAFAVAVAPPGPVHADEEPTVTIDGTICYEKVKEQGSNRLVVNLSEESKEDVVVTMHTEDGTAKSPEDYQGSDRIVVVIPAGKTSAEVPLRIVDDEKKEGDEYFLVIVDSVEGAATGTEKAEVVIKDGAPPRR